MDQKPFDAFKLCWNSIFQESAKCQNNFFDSRHCKILDSRDTSFEIVENRLAYIYKYGYFNILFFEKCFLLFLNSSSETVFPFGNLKVCSLSNGPGFDIIGLLRAVCISNKPLKALPLFNAINVHESWSGLFKALVSKSYEMSIAKSFREYFHLNPTNINLIQGDVYSTLTTETKNCISNSTVLLMVNVFASAKASPAIFEKSLKEIFNLLQPGSLIFFIGSKNNVKNFSKLDLKQHVKCVYGPQRVTLDNLPIDEQISNIMDVKPCDSGHANFIVWQKKNEILMSTEDKSLLEEECKDDSNTLSKLCSSFPSSGEKCESKKELKTSDGVDLNPDETKPRSFENMSHSMSHNYKGNSVETIASILNNLKLKHLNSKEQDLEDCQRDVLQFGSCSASDSIIETPNKSNHALSEKMSLEKSNQVIEKNGIGFKNDKISLVNQTMNANVIASQNTSNKKSKKSKQPPNKTKNQSIDANAKKDNHEHPKALQKILPMNKSCENSVKIEKGVIDSQTINTDELNSTHKNVQSLLHRCESLVSKLELLTCDIKKEINSRKDQVFNKIHVCNQLTNCGDFHHCCCINRVVHCCCSRKSCNY